MTQPSEPAPRPGGWRAGIQARAAGLGPTADRHNLIDATAHWNAIDSATRPRRARGRPAVRVAEWFDATEARRYEDALTALLDLRRAVLVSGAERGDFTVAAAHVPELTEEVKRLVPTDDPAFDAYLRLLHRIAITPVPEHAPAQPTANVVPEPRRTES